MSDCAIKVENLSKVYRIGQKEQRHETVAGSIASFLRSPWKNYRELRGLGRIDVGQTDEGGDENGGAEASSDILWALRDISFEVKYGEVVGIIGRNGAGKSTLLKILSRITEPTKGRAVIYGRVASLLEVGTGFHPDLTGRENVYLNGTILGMRKVEIDRKLDEIVAFAEVEKFMDTPVKRYSSGMRVRLAFAVAAHLEPEILIVDEVLAVGDLAFQRKCLGKMGEVASHGRTVLFVSHNLGAVRELCQTSVVLSNGRLQFRGGVVDGLCSYSQQVSDQSSQEKLRGTGWGGLHVHGVANGIATSLGGDEALRIECDLDVADTLTRISLFCIINDSVGDALLHNKIKQPDLKCESLSPGRHRVRVEFPSLWLSPGMYAVHFKLFAHTLEGVSVRSVSDVGMLDITGKTEGLGKARVVLNPPATWTLLESTAGDGSPTG